MIAGLALRLVSGGQTGADRAALDVAIERGVPYGGWCPRGGLAEDHPAAPGLLARYPHLRETPAADGEQRTAWNVRDSSATLVLRSGKDGAVSLLTGGTAFTVLCARLIFTRPFLIAPLGGPDDPPADVAMVGRVAEWLADLRAAPAPAPVQQAQGEVITLNVAGPRESQAPGIYAQAQAFLRGLLDRLSLQAISAGGSIR